MTLRSTVARSGDRKLVAGMTARTVVGLLSAMDAVLADLPDGADPAMNEFIDRIWALQEASEVFATQVQAYFDGKEEVDAG